MPSLPKTDYHALAMYLLSAVGGILLLSIFLTLLSALATIWGT